MHFIDACDAMVWICLTQRPPMINDVPSISIWNVDDRVVAGPGCDRRVLLQHFTDSLKRAGRRLANRISHGIILAGPATFGPHQIILATFPEHHRTLYIMFWRNFFESRAIRK